MYKLITTMATITAKLFDALLCWFQKPNETTNTELQALLSLSKQNWCKTVLDHVKQNNICLAHQVCFDTFGRMFDDDICDLCEMNVFKMKYSNYIVFEFTTNFIEGETVMSYKLLQYPPDIRRINQGPFLTQYYVVQFPIDTNEECPESAFHKMFDGGHKSVNIVRSYCEKNDISPSDVSKHNRAGLHMVVTTCMCNKITTYIRPIINQIDLTYKPVKNQHIMYCDLPRGQFHSIPTKTVIYYGDIIDVKEYRELYKHLESLKVGMWGDEIETESAPEPPKIEPELPKVNFEQVGPGMIKVTNPIAFIDALKSEELKFDGVVKEADQDHEKEYVVVPGLNVDVESEKVKVIADLKRQRDEILKQLETL